LADEEPKYLRRQKPLEIKRRKFGRETWKTVLLATAWTAAGCAAGVIAYDFARFLYSSPRMALIHPEQIVLAGNHYVLREQIIEIFAGDRGKSVLRIPLDERRRQIEAIPWVEQASVRRALPDKIAVEISERTPVAFLRQGSEMALIDAHGVILDLPLEGGFHFPVVTGISADMAPQDREDRIQLFSVFAQQLESVSSRALDQVSEVDLSDSHDLRAMISDLPAPAAVPGTADSFANAAPAAPETAADNSFAGPTQQAEADSPVLAHFGDSGFADKYRTLVANIVQWRATAGRVNSVDLRFSREAVVNADTPAVPAGVAQNAQPQGLAKHSR